MQSKSDFLGIDVTAGGRPFAFAVVSSATATQSDENICGLKEIGWIEPNVESILRLVKRVAPKGIAIDCPSGVPQGLSIKCCFAIPTDCECSITGNWHNGPQTMRIAEHELRSLGINLYATNKNSHASWKGLVVLLYPLWEQLSQMGFSLGQNLVETYPYGIWQHLFPDSPFEWRGGVKNDSYDSVLCAVTAEMHFQKRTQIYGIPSEGCIVLPK